MVELLRALGFVFRLSKLVPHRLTEAQRQHRVEAAVSLLWFRRTKARLNSIVTLRWEVRFVRQYSVKMVVVPSQWAQKIDSQAWAASGKGHSVNLTRQRGRGAVWTAATQQQHHCVGEMPTTKLFGQSNSTEGPPPRPHPLPFRQRQTPRCKYFTPEVARAGLGSAHPPIVLRRPCDFHLSSVPVLE